MRLQNSAERRHLSAENLAAVGATGTGSASVQQASILQKTSTENFENGKRLQCHNFLLSAPVSVRKTGQKRTKNEMEADYRMRGASENESSISPIDQLETTDLCHGDENDELSAHTNNKKRKINALEMTTVRVGEVNIKEDDLKTLDGRNWLKCTIVNAFFSLLQCEKVGLMDSFVYTFIRQGEVEYEKVAGWLNAEMLEKC